MSSTAFRENRFSIASYVLAVGVGCAVTGIGFAAIMGFPFPLWFLWGFFGVMFGVVRGALLFLPTVGAAILVLNVLRLRSPAAASALGAVGGAVTYFGVIGFAALQYAPAVYWQLGAIFALSGAAAGLVYFWGERV